MHLGGIKYSALPSVVVCICARVHFILMSLSEWTHFKETHRNYQVYITCDVFRSWV